MALTRVLVALVLGSTLLVASPAGAGAADYGRVWRGDGVLERGCAYYPFRYRVRPGPHDWAAEFFLRGPRGQGLGTVGKLSGADRVRGRGRFEICRTSTRPGRFTIRGKLTITRGFEQDVHWVKPTRFRLRRAG